MKIEDYWAGPMPVSVRAWVLSREGVLDDPKRVLVELVRASCGYRWAARCAAGEDLEKHLRHADMQRDEYNLLVKICVEGYRASTIQPVINQMVKIFGEKTTEAHLLRIVPNL